MRVTITWLHTEQTFFTDLKMTCMISLIIFATVLLLFSISLYIIKSTSHQLNLHLPTKSLSLTASRLLPDTSINPRSAAKQDQNLYNYIRSHLPWNFWEQHQQISWFTWFCFLPVANDFLSMGKGFPARAPLEKKSFLMFISNGGNFN